MSASPSCASLRGVPGANSACSKGSTNAEAEASLRKLWQMTWWVSAAKAGTRRSAGLRWDDVRFGSLADM
jgi:hypothetical protein